MLTFSDYLASEGILSIVPRFALLRKMIRDINTLPSLEAALEFVRTKYPQIWNTLHRLAGDKESVAAIEKKSQEANIKEAFDPILEEGAGEIAGELTRRGAATVQGIGEIGSILSKVMTIGGYGLAGAVLLFLAYKYRQSLINLTTDVLRLGLAGIKSVSKSLPGESDAMKKMRADRRRRDVERRPRRR